MKASGPTATSPLADGSGGTGAQRRLVCVHGLASSEPEFVPLPPADAPLEIGREPDDGFVLADETASRRHAEVAYLPRYDCYQVQDLGSKNGTFVDGRRIEAAVLEAGSVLRVGQHLLVMDELRLPARMELEAPADVSLARAWAELQVDRAAPSAAPLLIQGPTGAGKERLAARVHEMSGRTGAFVPVNCATLNRELLGSELFGHVKGAFSEARSDRAGLIASADRGTLFLDEVAELPLDQQPALLRVLQEKRLRPVGADREIEVDVRVVSATHRDLEAESASGAFRSDLFGRLAGLEIELPGLSARRVEILPLLRKAVPELRPSVEAAEALLLHSWPRNVRELQAVAHRLEMFGTDTLDLPLLPEAIRARAEPQAAPRAPPPPGEKPSKAKLERLLGEHEGRVAEVARSLALTRQSVYRLLEEHGLSPAEFRRKKRR